MQKFKINYYPFIVNFRWGKKQSQKIDSCWEKQIEFQSTKDPSFHYQKFFLFVAFGTQLRKNIQLWKQNTYKLYQIELTDRKDFREKSTKEFSGAISIPLSITHWNVRTWKLRNPNMSWDKQDDFEILEICAIIDLHMFSSTLKKIVYDRNNKSKYNFNLPFCSKTKRQPSRIAILIPYRQIKVNTFIYVLTILGKTCQQFPSCAPSRQPPPPPKKKI